MNYGDRLKDCGSSTYFLKLLPWGGGLWSPEPLNSGFLSELVNTDLDLAEI